jgi:GNAT superfamily N-acetyltransferase
MGEPVIALTSERDPRAEAVVTGGLADYNRETFGRVDTRPLDVLVRDPENGEIVGGILGRSSLGMFFLDLFYLPEQLRRGGLGSRLIAQAEEEARRRGCTRAFVITVTFQAPGFTRNTAIAGLARSRAHPTARHGFFSASRSNDAAYGAGSRQG